jgi:hypothetical protein
MAMLSSSLKRGTTTETSGGIVEGDLQPLESFVFLATHGVNLSDLIREPFSGLGQQIGQGRVGGLTISDHLLRDGEFETAITFVRFQLRFTQGRLAVAALGGDEYLPSMTGSTGRLQVCGPACGRICLIQFSGIEKNASQIAVRCSRQRVEFHRLPCLTLGLIDSP